MKPIYLTHFLFFALFPCANAQEQDITGDYMDHIHQVSAEQLEAQWKQDSAEQEQAGWDEHFHTSDLPGERGTGFSRSDDPPKGLRVGCICMDYSRRDERGKGACSGYGGVRFWIYQVAEDSVAYFPTENHWAHPDSLSQEELMNLSSRNTDEPLGAAPGRRGLPFGEIALGMMVCLTIAYIAKLWFDRGEFFH